MIKAFFNENVDEITVHGLTQWDKGQRLEITLSSLPASFEVHFSYRRHDMAYVVEATATDGVAVVAIPNLILQQPYDAIAWLYVTEGDAGETIKTINLPIEARTKPSDYVYTEIEILDYKNLDKRIDTLEKGDASEETIKAAVESYLEENPVTGGTGLTDAQITALDGMFKIAAYTTDATEAYAAFKAAFGIEGGGEVEPDEPTKTLTGISATYSGGDVAAGTAVSALTGIVVTATYSDGSTEAVTGYALSGTIAEGSNTITVTYGGKTTTFTVTGIAESGGDEPGEIVDTTARIAHYETGLGIEGVLLDDGLLPAYCVTDYYNIPEGYTGKVTGVIFYDDSSDYHTKYAKLCVYDAEGNFDGIYRSYSSMAQKYTGAEGTPVNIRLYYADGWPTENARFKMALLTKYIDYDYLYYTDTGDIIFAGKNTPYYGMANIDGTMA